MAPWGGTNGAGRGVLKTKRGRVGVWAALPTTNGQRVSGLGTCGLHHVLLAISLIFLPPSPLSYSGVSFAGLLKSMGGKPRFVDLVEGVLFGSGVSFSERARLTIPYLPRHLLTLRDVGYFVDLDL